MVGSYGIRPTIDALALDGVIPLAEAMDTAGFFCLDPFKFAQIHRVWYNNTVVSTTKPYNSFPRTIVYPTDSLPLANPAAQTIYDDFLSKLEDAYGMTVRPTNVSNIVRQSPNPLVRFVMLLMLFARAEYVKQQFHFVWCTKQSAGRILLVSFKESRSLREY